MTMNFPYDEERVAEMLQDATSRARGMGQGRSGASRGPARDRRDAAQVEADKEFRAAVTADLEAALEAAGYELDPKLLPALRERLSSV